MSGNKTIKKLPLLLLCVALISLVACKGNATNNSGSHSTTKDTEISSSYKEEDAIGTTVDTTVGNGSVNSEHKSSLVSSSTKNTEASNENILSDIENSNETIIIEKDYSKSSNSSISNSESKENSTYFDGSIELPDHEWN